MEDDFLSINVEYWFSSFLCTPDEGSCIKEYFGKIYSGPFKDNSENEYVGEVQCKVIYLSHAIDARLDIYEMFDTYEYTYRHGQSFYDFKKSTFKKPILKIFPELEFFSSRICIIETMGILPQFRGKKIGAKVFKDMVWNLGSECSLYIIQPYPLQFEHSENNSKLLSVLQLEKLEQSQEKAIKSLSDYYTTWGFKKLKPITDLLFYSPLHLNPVFDSIDMDDL